MLSLLMSSFGYPYPQDLNVGFREGSGYLNRDVVSSPGCLEQLQSLCVAWLVKLEELSLEDQAIAARSAAVHQGTSNCVGSCFFGVCSDAGSTGSIHEDPHPSHCVTKNYE